MATMKAEYLLKLDEEDAAALKMVLGNMDDDEFSKLGVSGDDRKRMSVIYDLLPTPSMRGGSVLL